MVKHRLVFVQISDIHFHICSGDTYDIDTDIRDAALNDIRNNAKETLEEVDGVLVCGDLAFSARPEEYEAAKDFLRNMIDVFGIPMSKVYCVPGNHDVDQAAIRNSMYILDAQDKLLKAEQKDFDSVDATLRKIMNSPGSEGILLAGLKNYMKFAEEMMCTHTSDRQYWQSKLPLGNYEVVLHGMNSVYISSHRDHKTDDGKPVTEERKMIMNKGQLPRAKEGTIYLSMCHHPPACWSNHKISDFMDGRVKIQLYGHKHRQSIDANRERVRIYSQKRMTQILAQTLTWQKS